MSSTPPFKPERLDSVDSLRGLVIVLMALDHTRDFFGGMLFGGAESPAFTSPGVFFTRWVTHFCAPTFVLLAGLGAYLARTRGLSTPALAGFLFTRGLWLVVLELTVVDFGWSWDWNFRNAILQVIWAIGWSMVGLSVLVWLPSWVIGLLGVVIIVGHNIFDGVTGSKLVTEHPWLVHVLGEQGWFWDLLHTPYRSFQPAKGWGYFNLYPLLPWFGVLCAGYGLGPLMTQPAPRRHRGLLLLGLLLIFGFVVLRWFNVYGDPSRWMVILTRDQGVNELRTVMSFLACTKYPPSLLFLLMTLGPALVLLVVLERRLPYFKHFFLTLGRVPLFFYLIHLPVIHGLARLDIWRRIDPVAGGLFPGDSTGLPRVYLTWTIVVLLLYFPCRGYGWLKKRYGGVFKYRNDSGQ
jgi:uncharacterized membrane protein